MALTQVLSSQVKYKQSGTGSVIRSLEGKLQESVSVFDFMTAEEIADVQARTLARNVHDAIQNAFDAVGIGGYVYFPEGNYRSDSKLTFSCAFGGDVGAEMDNPNQEPWNGSMITYTGNDTALECEIQPYGCIIENLGIKLTGSGLIGIDFKYGGNLNHVRKLNIKAENATTPCNYGIYLRGVNPDTNVSNSHQHSNKFEHITVWGNMLTGIKLGDDKDGESLANGNYIDHFIEYLDPADPDAAKVIYINGYGSLISHPVLSGNGATIRLYGQVGNVAIVGGYFDSALATAIYVDADVGQRYVFTAYGCHGLTSTDVIDTIEPSSSSRYAIYGEYNYIPDISVLYLRGIGTEPVTLTSNIVAPKVITPEIDSAGTGVSVPTRMTINGGSATHENAVVEIGGEIPYVFTPDREMHIVHPSGGALVLGKDTTDYSYIAHDNATRKSNWMYRGNVGMSINELGQKLLTGIIEYADDAAAATGGIPVTGVYRTGSALKIRVS